MPNSRRLAAAVAVVAVGAIGAGWAALGTAPASSPAAPSPAAPAGAEPPAQPPAAWNGVAWRELPRPFEIGPARGHDWIDGVVQTSAGLIGWGRAGTPGRNQFNDMGAVYLSHDGLTWTTVRIDVGVGRSDTSELRWVSAGPAGLLALGGVCCDEDRPALWRSADGVAWERLPYPDTLVGAEIGDLVGTTSNYVVAGAIGGRATIWSSDDGATWVEIDPAEAGLGAGAVGDITASPDGFLALGFADGQTWDGAMWSSPDGLRWTRAAVDPLFTTALDTSLGSAVVSGDRMIVIGHEGPRAERIRCMQMGLDGVQVASARELVPNPPELAFSCAWGWESRWIADVDDWRAIAMDFNAENLPQRGELIEFRLLAAGGPGFVSLGEGFEDGFPSLFVSADGATWDRVPAIGGFKPGQSVSGMALSGGRVVAVGESWDPNAPEPGVPAVWVGDLR